MLPFVRGGTISRLICAIRLFFRVRVLSSGSTGRKSQELAHGQPILVPTEKAADIVRPIVSAIEVGGKIVGDKLGI